MDPVEGGCETGYTSANTGGLGHECLKVKEGMHMLASRFETRRYAGVCPPPPIRPVCALPPPPAAGREREGEAQATRAPRALGVTTDHVMGVQLSWGAPASSASQFPTTPPDAFAFRARCVGPKC